MSVGSVPFRESQWKTLISASRDQFRVNAAFVERKQSGARRETEKRGKGFGLRLDRWNSHASVPSNPLGPIN